jgi:5'(3')-deoxyribonucleotidase
MRILVDCDGVLADFVQGMFNVIDELYGLTFTEDQLTDWNFHSLNLGKERERSVWERVGHAGFAQALHPYDGAGEALEQLRVHHDVYVVSSPFWGPTFCYDRAQWLLQRGMIPSTRKLVLAESKYVVAGDVLIDDRESNIQEWLEHNPNGYGFLWSRSYNVNAEKVITLPANRWERTNDWARVLQFAAARHSKGTV